MCSGLFTIETTAAIPPCSGLANAVWLSPLSMSSEGRTEEVKDRLVADLRLLQVRGMSCQRYRNKSRAWDPGFDLLGDGHRENRVFFPVENQRGYVDVRELRAVVRLA